MASTTMLQRLGERRIALLGTGKIGAILLQGLLKAGLSPERACGTVRHAERARLLSDQLAIPVGTDNRAAARQADVLLVSVKPQNVREVLEEIGAEVSPDKLIVSVAASVPTAFIEKTLGTAVPVVRAMPNTPCLVGTGMTGLCKGDHPALPKDAVTTPAGCTIDGILELEEGGLRVTLIKAIVRATARARELLDR